MLSAKLTPAAADTEPRDSRPFSYLPKGREGQGRTLWDTLRGIIYCYDPVMWTSQLGGWREGWMDGGREGGREGRCHDECQVGGGGRGGEERR